MKAISLTGVQGPHGAGQDDYKRNRTIRLTMSSDHTDAMYAAYEAGRTPRLHHLGPRTC